MINKAFKRSKTYMGKTLTKLLNTFLCCTAWKPTNKGLQRIHPRTD